MPLFDLQFDLSELKRVIRWTDTLGPVVDNPRALAPAVRIMGKAMISQFQSEGATGGAGWQDLSGMTQDVRQERGYGREHPILVQGGGLKGVTADTLSRWNLATVAAVQADGNNVMTASIMNRQFKATVSGPKVKNHFGGNEVTGGRGRRRFDSKRRANFLPKRQFFSIMPGIEKEMADAVVERVMIDWSNRGSGARRV